MKNSGFYSEIIEVKVDGKRVFFNESSQQGESEIFYKKKNLVSLTFNEEKLNLEIEQEQDRDRILILKQTLKEKVSTSSYSLTFLKVVKNFCTILDIQDRIVFSIKTDTPLKVQISFKKLNKTTLTFYLAPRVPEEVFEEDDDEF